MNIRKTVVFTFVLAVIVSVASFIGCERVPQIAQPTVPLPEGISGEILVGAVYPITGHSSLQAGPSVEYGIELAVSEINASQHSDVKIKIIMEDGQSTVEGAVEAFNKLIHEDNVSVILGPGSSSQAQEAFPIAHQNQVVAISPTSAATGLSAF